MIRDVIYEIIKKDFGQDVNNNTLFSSFTTSMGILEILLSIEEAGYDSKLIEATSLIKVGDMINEMEKMIRGY